MDRELKSDTRYVLGIKWDPKPEDVVDFDYWCDDDLEYLLKRFFLAKKGGFDTSIGSCPNLRIITLFEGNKEFTRNEINRMIEVL